ncbi:MAG: hypothetical protein AAF642_04905 [Pseudomonadota bacterium]
MLESNTIFTQDILYLLGIGGAMFALSTNIFSSNIESIRSNGRGRTALMAASVFSPIFCWLVLVFTSDVWQAWPKFVTIPLLLLLVFGVLIFAGLIALALWQMSEPDL